MTARISFPAGKVFLQRYVQTNQLTNHTNLLHYFNVQDFHKAYSCRVVKVLTSIMNPDGSSVCS